MVAGPDVPEMIDRLEAIARAAGEIILEVRDRGVEHIAKQDGSPVTEADTRAEALILDALASAWPDIPVVAEESAAAGRLPDELGSRFFLVDPLDGTREFIAGSTDFTVNIALIENGAPVAGVVGAPARGEIYLARHDQAWLVIEENGKHLRRAIAVRPCPKNPVALVSRSHLTDRTRRFLAEHGLSENLEIGSSLKFCLLACGLADIYPRFGRTMEWDTAAGDAVLRAAGGITVEPDGEPLRYGKRENGFANPDFIACTHHPRLASVIPAPFSDNHP